MCDRRRRSLSSRHLTTAACHGGIAGCTTGGRRGAAARLGACLVQGAQLHDRRVDGVGAGGAQLGEDAVQLIERRLERAELGTEGGARKAPAATLVVLEDETRTGQLWLSVVVGGRISRGRHNRLDEHERRERAGRSRREAKLHGFRKPRERRIVTRGNAARADLTSVNVT